METFIHTDKNGKYYKLSEIGLNHLKKIVARIERISKDGVVVRSGGGSCSEDYWYDEDILYGEEALENLDYYEYKRELEKRVTPTQETCKIPSSSQPTLLKG